MARLLPLQAHRRHTPDQTPDTRNNDALRAAMQTAPGLGARRLNYHMSPHARLPIITLCSALLAAGGAQGRNQPPAQPSRACVRVCVQLAVQPRYTPSTVQYMSALLNLPSRATVSSMSASMPVLPAARLRSMSCLSPCREVRSRSVGVSAPAPPPVPVPVPAPSHAVANMRPLPAPCPVPVPSHPLLHVHTHLHVDSRPAATATQHPVRGRVKARRPRGEAV